MHTPPIVALRLFPGVHLLRDYEVCVMPGVCGNKARKLAGLAAAPWLPAELVSHGGPQSNAMLALARLAAACGGRLTYHTTPLPRWLRDAPTGNLAAALGCGMTLCEHPTRRAYDEACAAAEAAAGTASSVPGGGVRATGWVERGGASPSAELGVSQLAADIGRWMSTRSAGPASVSAPLAGGPPPDSSTSGQVTAVDQDQRPGPYPRLDTIGAADRAELLEVLRWTHGEFEAGARDPVVHVMLPCGTGTTALFLARHAPPGARVHGVPCVGDGMYLDRQMRELDLASGGSGGHRASVLPPPERYAVPFGAVSPALLRSWRHARAHGVLLDLVYGPVAWAALRAYRWRHRRALLPRGRRRAGGLAAAAGGDGGVDRPTLLYVHTGGHEGLPSQLRRYARAGLVGPEEEAEATADAQAILSWQLRGAPPG